MFHLTYSAVFCWSLCTTAFTVSSTQIRHVEFGKTNRGGSNYCVGASAKTCVWVCYKVTNFSSDLKENPAKWCVGPPFHMSPVSCTDYVGEKTPPPQPGHTQTEQPEEKTNPGPNKYMKVWFN